MLLTLEIPVKLILKRRLKAQKSVTKSKNIVQISFILNLLKWKCAMCDYVNASNRINKEQFVNNLSFKWSCMKENVHE